MAAQGTIGYSIYQWSAQTQVTLPGVTRTLSYDALLRPTAIKAQAIGSGAPANPQGPVFMDYRYIYNEVSDITQRTTEDGVYAYGYDALDRITSATPPASVQPTLPVEGYSYDAVHNRPPSAHQPGPWAYNADNQLLGYGQGVGQSSYQYDANGHPVRRTFGSQTQTLNYDVAERLVGVDVPSASYYYDPMGRRLTKIIGGKTTYFQYADEGLVAEYDATGLPSTIYGWQPDGAWGTNPQFKRDTNTYRFYHNDHLGTPQRLSDVAGSLAWSGKAEAFGKTTVDTEAVTNPLRFPGQYFDAETGTHYNYFRDYDPTIGRYEQSDPIGLAGGLNTYVYAKSSPIQLFDYTGQSIPLAAAFLVTGAACGVVACALYASLKCDSTYPDHNDPLSPDAPLFINCFDAALKTCLLALILADPINETIKKIIEHYNERAHPN